MASGKELNMHPWQGRAEVFEVKKKQSKKGSGIYHGTIPIQFIGKPGKKYYAQLRKCIYDSIGNSVGYEDLKRYIQLKEAKKP